MCKLCVLLFQSRVSVALISFLKGLASKFELSLPQDCNLVSPERVAECPMLLAWSPEVLEMTWICLRRKNIENKNHFPSLSPNFP